MSCTLVDILTIKTNLTSRIVNIISTIIKIILMAIMFSYLPYGLIAQGIYSGMIGATGTVAIGTCNIIRSLYKHQNPDVNKFIVALDIERRLKLIHSVLNV